MNNNQKTLSEINLLSFLFIDGKIANFKIPRMVILSFANKSTHGGVPHTLHVIADCHAAQSIKDLIKYYGHETC